VEVELIDIGRIVSGGTPSTKESSYWGGDISWISPADLTGYNSKYISKGNKSITDEGLRNSSAAIMPAGSIHFSSRAPIGYTVISSRNMTTNQGFKSIIPANGIFNEYVYYFLKGSKQLAESKATGTTFKEISGAAFSKLPIPIPPANEQHRIVAKIETLFSELDKGIESFKTAREQLKIYRQSLLKHAFSGKLTEQWRAENPDKLENAQALLQRIETERQQRYQQQLKDWKQSKSPPAPLFQRGGQATKLQQTGVVAHNTIPPFEKGGLGGISKPKLPKALPPLTAEELAALPELPEGWAWCRLGEFIDSIDAGKSFKCDEREPNQNEIGVAKVSAVTWGEYDESESKTCIDPSKINPNYFVAQNDFILSRANTIDLVGACVIARKVTKRIMLSDKTLRINFDGFNQKYFLQYLRSRFGRKQIMELSTGNQESMRNIGQERIQSIIVPICSTSESDYVVDSLDSKLSQIDQLDQTITTALQQAEALRQSILKKAFSGQLVPQDPSDEPASVLLERIRVEKAQADIQPVRRRGKTS
jgi:type I restriction enzyme S subunit